jgi:hypothetical protein
MNLLTRITRSLSVLVVTACTSMVFAADDELWYPRTLQSEKGSAVIYAPQIDNWDNFETIKAWTAFSITTAGSEESWYGSMRFTARTDTDIAAREVLLHDVEVLELSIDGLAEDSEEYALIHDGFTSMSRKVPLDLVLAYLPRSVPLDTTEGLNTEPPQIFVSDSPAILLFIDGEPRFLPVDGSGLQFVLNTPWDVLREGEDGPLYLCHDDAWLSSSALDAKWQWATRLPANLDKLPHGPNWDRLRDCLPEQLDKLSEPEATPPIVYYSTEAAELLLTDGEPRWAAIGDRGLNYATNTEQELFRVDDIYFLLLSGRWFSTAQLDGPWALARQLPDAFQDIPPEDSAQAHEMSYVRSSIPGTEEAWEAALLASIPRKAEIQRGSEDTLDIAVSYAGEPVFAPIEETGIDLAVNTSYQVLRYEGVYFLCHNATWLTAPSASGPWKFADSIPDVFATIPPSSPAYNTTFVKIDGSNEESIYYAYKSGYDGAYVENETVVQGTGYAAPAVTVAFAYTYASGYPYPYYPYYWWPPTYGYGSWYNPNTGRYGEAVVGYGPYGAAGSAAFYNPETGVYGRGQGVWDSDEFAGRGYAYNPNTNTSMARNRYIDFDDNEGWSQRVARRGDEWRYTESEWQDGRMLSEFESSRGTEGVVTRERQGDAIVSEGTVTGDNRSAEFSSVIEDGNLSGNISGSEGGSGTYDRQLEEGTITGGGTYTKDGKTIETDVTRTAEGVQREFETSGGGQGVSQRSGDSNQFLYESGSGDVYAGRDGNVYQKTDDGWSQVENPGSEASTARERSQESSQRAATTSAQGAPGRDFGEGDRQRSSRGNYGSGEYGGYDLNRDYQNRQRGYDRYQRHQAMGGQGSRGGARHGRRRRR